MRRTIDCHMHCLAGQPEAVVRVATRQGYEKYNVLACPCLAGFLNTLECLRVKRLSPHNAYVFGGLVYFDGETGQGLETQLEYMLEAGVDGLKLLETKPDQMKRLGRPLDGPDYAGIFARAQALGVPILWHVGDPATFWDAQRAPDFAVENGWCYTDGTFPSLEALYAQTERVLTRYPELHVVLAHLYFTSDDRKHAERVLERHPMLCLDVTPGTEMYRDFLADPRGWEAFFERYQKRILFGTDLCDESEADETAREIIALEHAVLEGRDVAVWDIRGEGLQLSEETLKAVYAKNFERLAGDKPKPLCTQGLEHLAAYYARRIKETMDGQTALSLIRRMEALLA